MNCTNISDVRMFPAIVIDNRPVRIHLSRDTYHSLDERILCGMAVLQTWETHAFVNENPCNHTGIVVIAFYGATPFRGQPLFGLGRPFPSVGHLAPHKQT